MKYTENSRSDSRIISSSSRRHVSKSDVIISRTPISHKIYDVLMKLLFVFELLMLIALIVYVTVTELIPIKYIFALVLLLGISSGVHVWLLSGRRKFTLKRTVSFVLSILIFSASIFGMSMIGAIHGSLNDFDFDKSGVDPQKVKVTKKPFIVYLSGLDTRNSGEIAEKGLSDVNMIIVVNPQKAKVLMVSIPRDYYVPLWGEKNKMDKLTHAGKYGIECSMETLETLFGIEFNYYAKVNFKSVYDIVNAVGGITVYSEYNFSSRHSYTEKVYRFVKGPNELNGDSALAFARERDSFITGDRQRGIHQQMVIKAIVEKAISPAMLKPSKIKSILNAVTSNTKTNFTYDEISSLVNYQLDKTPTWDFKTISVDGVGESNYTYTYPRQRLYVMRPDMETVDAAIREIKIALDELPDTEVTSSVVSSK